MVGGNGEESSQQVLVKPLCSEDDGQPFLLDLGILLFGWGQRSGCKCDRLLAAIFHLVRQNSSHAIG